MKMIKNSLILLVFTLVCLPNSVSARTSFHIGIGYGYPHYYYRCHPHYGWYSGYYNWIDRGYYRWLDRDRYGCVFACAPGCHHWPRHRCSTHVGFWIDDCCPGVIVGTPVIVERSKVITKKEITIKPRYDDETLKLFKSLRTKKSKLLKKLKLGDNEARKKAINELAGFSFDDKVRKALEDILLSDPDSELRKEAAKSFAKVKNKKSLPALEKVRIEDSDKEVREEADKAIKAITG